VLGLYYVTLLTIIFIFFSLSVLSDKRGLSIVKYFCYIVIVILLILFV